MSPTSVINMYQLCCNWNMLPPLLSGTWKEQRVKWENRAQYIWQYMWQVFKEHVKYCMLYKYSFIYLLSEHKRKLNGAVCSVHVHAMRKYSYSIARFERHFAAVIICQRDFIPLFLIQRHRNGYVLRWYSYTKARWWL